MRVFNVRGDLFYGDRSHGSVIARNADIVANEANWADSGIIPTSASAFEFDENQISPFLVRKLGLFGIVESHGSYLPRLLARTKIRFGYFSQTTPDGRPNRR